MTRKSETAIDRMIRHASDGLSASPAHAASKAAAIAALRHFLEWRKSDERAPAATELRVYLAELLEIAGDPAAFNRFSFSMIAASHLWGREATTVYAMVLRDARVREKPARKSDWDVVRARAETLPDEWRARVVATLPREGDAARPSISWSPAYAEAVISALRQWIKHHEHEAVLPLLSGTDLHAFGEALDLAGKSHRTIRDYITRVYAGYRTWIEPGVTSFAAEIVIEEWTTRASCAPYVMKSAAQIVSATRLYELGFSLVQEARSAPMAGGEAAKEFRNGLLIAVAAALPQRARALSALVFDDSLYLEGDSVIRIRLERKHLKMPEAQKQGPPLILSFRNSRLWAVLEEYRRDYRPVFDRGDGLFASMKQKNAVISEKSLGKLVGDLTKRHLGVRVSVHRMRDNVATEANEHMPNGKHLAPRILGNRSEAIVTQHYDRSDGHVAAREFGQLVDAMKTRQVEIDL